MTTPVYNEAAQKEFCAEISAHYGNAEFVDTKQINEFIAARGVPFPHFLVQDKSNKFDKYRVRKESETVSAPVAETTPAPVTSTVSEKTKKVMAVGKKAEVGRAKIAASITDTLHPKKNDTYVPFGFYNDLKSIVAAGIFYPVYITGLSGNGKTLMVEQVCAALGREMIRVNITKETDETDLIGSYELIDGNTVRREGPAILAMKKGAILLLDETDYGSERLLCLQPILEGKPYFDKKSGEVIFPQPGFNVIATANTKGKGSDDGRFVGANVLNEAFLERFAITVEQEYPELKVEKKILEKNFSEFNITDLSFVDRLVAWAEIIRKSYAEGVGTEIISTRRLVHIAKAYSIFGNRLKAIELCLNRFDTETKTGFLDLYTKVDQDAVPPVANTAGYDPETLSAINTDINALLNQQVPTHTPVAPPTQPQMPSQNPAEEMARKSLKDALHNKRKSLSDSAFRNTKDTSGVANLAWATPMMLKNAFDAYGSLIELSYDMGTQTYTVESHGYRVQAKKHIIDTYNPAGVLNMLVEMNQKGSRGEKFLNPFI